MKQKKTQVLSFVIMMVFGGAVGYIGAKLGLDWAKTLPTSHAVILLTLILPAFLLVIAFHEAGHALAGSLVKFDFKMYVVGPFMWNKEITGWKFKWNTNVNLSGGLVVCLPTNTHNLAKRFSVYALGGPVASLLVTGIAYALHKLLLSFNFNNYASLSITASFFAIIAYLSLFIFIATMIPVHMNGFFTDGARAFRFLRGGDTSRFETLLMKVITSSSGGIRPGELDEKEVQEALVLGNKLKARMAVYVHSYLFQIALDKKRFDEAETHLQNYIADVENIPKGLRGTVYLDAAFFYAHIRKDLSKAEAYWKQYVPSAILPKAQALAAEAAILLLRKDHAAGTEKIDMALKELPNMLDRGVAAALHGQLVQMKFDHAEMV